MSHSDWLSGPYWRTVFTAENTPPYARYMGPLPKSASDDRAYRLLRLSNGVQAVLVQDERTEMAAVSVHLSVGHLQDPVRSHPQAFTAPKLMISAA